MIIAVICGAIGIIGSFAPVLPGPPLSWVGVLLVYLWGGTNAAGEPMSLTILLVMLGLTILVSIIDYVIPAWFTKVTGGSKYAGRGAMVGMLLGMFFIPPWGMILGSVLGSFLMEMYYGGKSSGDSFKSSMGAFLGFLLGSGIKIVACAVMLYYIIVYI